MPASVAAFQDLEHVSTVKLLELCLTDRDDSAAWRAFLFRILPKVKQFVRGTVRRLMVGSLAVSRSDLMHGAFQECDLIQAVMLRLVERECALLARFSGKTEEHLLAYLAVISRSVVREWLRSENALKRSSDSAKRAEAWCYFHREVETDNLTAKLIERGVLRRELRELAESILNGASNRDRLVFRLYFFEDLSTHQIAQCRAIGLSRAGVMKVLNRIIRKVRKLAISRNPAAGFQAA